MASTRVKRQKTKLVVYGKRRPGHITPPAARLWELSSPSAKSPLFIQDNSTGPRVSTTCPAARLPIKPNMFSNVPKTSSDPVDSALSDRYALLPSISSLTLSVSSDNPKGNDQLVHEPEPIADLPQPVPRSEPRCQPLTSLRKTLPATRLRRSPSLMLFGAPTTPSSVQTWLAHDGFEEHELDSRGRIPSSRAAGKRRPCRITKRAVLFGMLELGKGPLP